MTSTDQGQRQADRYAEVYFHIAEFGRRLVTFAGPPVGTRLLDVGAGRGAVARAALASGCAVTAVDASAEAVSRLRADHPDIVVYQRDADALGFADGSFDVVSAGFVVQELTEPLPVLAEFRRVLAPGGTVALSLERRETGRLDWLHDLNRSFFGSDEASSPLTPGELDRLLLSAGFTSPTSVTVTLVKPLPDPAALWDWLTLQGVAAAVDALPTNRALAYRERFFRAADQVHRTGGITLTVTATLHRATAP